MMRGVNVYTGHELCLYVRHTSRISEERKWRRT